MPMRSGISISVRRRGTEKRLQLPSGSKAEDVIRGLGLNISTHIVLRGNMPIPIDDGINDGEVLDLIETVSGG